MAPHEGFSAAVTDSKYNQSAKNTPPDSYSSLMVSGVSKTLTRSPPETSTALCQLQSLPRPVNLRSMVWGSSP